MRNRNVLHAALVLVASLSLTKTVVAAGADEDIEQVAKVLKLSPQQKLQLAPILRAEGPRVNAIKNDASLSKAQKLERLSALHQQTDPQVRAILSPQQSQKLQKIREKEIAEAVKK